MADAETKAKRTATKRSVAKAIVSPLSAARQKARDAVEKSRTNKVVGSMANPEGLAEDVARVIERGLTPNPSTGTIDVPYAQGRITPSQLEEMQSSERYRPLRVSDAPNAPTSVNPRSPLLRARQSLAPDYFEPDKSAIINLSGDRSRVGKVYVDGNWYTIPGGADYGLTRGSGLWANAEDPALQIRDLGDELLAQGIKPYGSYLTYGSFGSDSSLPFVQMSRNMMEKQRRNNYRPVTEESIQALDNKIRSITKDGEQVYPDYPGALSPDLDAWLAKSFDRRNAFAQSMGAPKMVKNYNFPDITAARRAMQDPRLRGLPNDGALIDDSGRKLYEGFGGHMIGELDTKAPVRQSATNWLPNQSFPTRVEGRGFGGFDQPIPRSLLFRDTVQNMRDLGKRPDKDYRPFQLAPQVQIIDSRWIDDIGRYIDRANELGIQDMLVNRYDDGGKVRGKIPAKIAGGLARFRDAPTKKIEDWNWRPMENVAEDLAAPGALDIEGDTFKLPAHVHPFGDFMLEQARRADTQGLTPRDLVKAYTTTRSSMQRQAINREKLERAGLPLSSSEQMIRPEGAFADWLKTPMGQRYLDAAVKGVPDADAINEARRVMKNFGFQNTLAKDMVYAAQNIPSLTPQASDLVARAYHGKSEPQEWRDLVRGVKGIDAAKSGFMSSMLGRGDNPTLDARQLQLHTPDDNNLAKYGKRRDKKLPMTGGDEAVERLAARQRLLGVEMPSRLDPMYQHLTHHGVWDATSGTKTTHQDIIDMMQGYESGGRVKSANAGAMEAHRERMESAQRERTLRAVADNYARRERNDMLRDASDVMGQGIDFARENPMQAALNTGQFVFDMVRPHDMTDLGVMLAMSSVTGPFAGPVMRMAPKVGRMIAPMIGSPLRRATIGGGMIAADPGEMGAAPKYAEGGEVRAFSDGGIKGKIVSLGRGALRRIGEGTGYKSVPGKPATVEIPTIGRVETLPIPQLEGAASDYMQRIGRPGEHSISEYPEFDEDLARRIARAYDEMKHDPSDPAVQRTYQALADETMAQLDAIKRSGLDIRFLKPGMEDPYARSPALGYADIIENNRLYTFPTDFGFGTTESNANLLSSFKHPMLTPIGRLGDKDNAVVNDAFRVVHDAFGHFGPGNPFFRHKGEERAWLNHAPMYSPDARPAAANELRGQNSYVNFGPHAEQNAKASGADTIYADQKLGLMPEWTWTERSKKKPVEKADGGSVSGGGMNLSGNAVEREPLPKPEIPDLSNMSFEKAFATARRMGAPTFHWRRAGGKHNTFSTRVAESAGQIERRVNARTPAGPAPTQDVGAPMMTPVAPPGGEDQQPGLPMGMPTRNTGDTERMRAMLDEMMREERTREAEMPSYLYQQPTQMKRGGALRRMQRAS